MTAMTAKLCPVCGIEYHVPSAWEREQKRLGGKGGWWCPNGHQRVYRTSDEDDLRAERDRLKQDAAYKDDRIRELQVSSAIAWRKVSAAKGQITKIKKRASNGICPCCNRTFSDLARHMGTKHPNYVAEPTADEHIH